MMFDLLCVTYFINKTSKFVLLFGRIHDLHRHPLTHTHTLVAIVIVFRSTHTPTHCLPTLSPSQMGSICLQHGCMCVRQGQPLLLRLATLPMAMAGADWLLDCVAEDTPTIEQSLAFLGHLPRFYCQCLLSCCCSQSGLCEAMLRLIELQTSILRLIA